MKIETIKFNFILIVFMVEIAKNIISRQNEILYDYGYYCHNTFISTFNTLPILRKNKSYNNIIMDIDNFKEWINELQEYKNKIIKYDNTIINNIMIFVKNEIIIKEIEKVIKYGVDTWREFIIKKKTSELNNDRLKRNLISLINKYIKNTVQNYLLKITNDIELFIKNNIKTFKQTKKIDIHIDENLILTFSDKTRIINRCFDYTINIKDITSLYSFLEDKK